MSTLDVVSLLGAIATFLFGMSTMTDGLEKLSSGRLEGIMEKLTNNIFMSVLVGALVTGLIHSSAATTIMCVGFVNSGIMKLEQTVGIIMGANIGTTITAQILRLGDISSDNIILSLMKPEYFGPLLALAGIVLYMFLKGGKKKIVGQFLLGLGLLGLLLLLLLLLLLGKKTVRFETGCDSKIKDQKVKKGGLVTRPEQPVRPGRAFAGWYADESCTKRWDFDNDKVEDNMTLYAKWL